MKPNYQLRIIILILFALNFKLQTLNCFAQEEFPIDTFMYSPHWFNDLEEAKKDPQNVWYLDLNLQKHKQFPFDICQMLNLKRLDLSFNHFAMIPTLISNLQKLEWMDISGNYYLNVLPESLGKLQNLKEFRATDNRLKAGELDKVRKLLPNCKIVTK